jgi:glutamate-1-semialdehyde 2,1-aminomutase
MKLGGLDHNQPRVFLLSTTHGAETHALAAALEVIRIYKELSVVQGLWQRGERLQSAINQLAVSHGIADKFVVLGRPCNLVYQTKDGEGEPSQVFRTLFLQELIRGGILAPSLVVSFSHSAADIDRTLDVVDRALAVYARGIEEGPDNYLLGRPVKRVNRRFA